MPLSLGQNLSQRATMTQQLSAQMRQSLHLLQASSMELRALLRREADQNPALEVEEPSDLSLDAAREAWDAAPAEAPATAAFPEGSDAAVSPAEPAEPPPSGPEESPAGAAPPAPDDAADAPDDATPEGEDDFAVLGKLDDADYLFSDGGNNEYDPDAEERRQFFLDSIPATESLQEHLAEQLDACDLSPADRELAGEIVGSIEDDGYLRTPLADVAQARLAPLADCERLLALVQGFDPPGVGARDLRECLLLQLRADPPSGPDGRLALRLAENPDAFAAVESRRPARVAARLGCTEDEAAAAIRFLGRLDPRPGRRFSAERPVFVHAEIVVRKVDGRWTAFLDESDLPRVSVSRACLDRRAEIRGRPPAALPPAVREERREEREWLDARIRAAELLVQGVSRRQATLLSVAQAVVDAQTDYFERGKPALRPLGMGAVARTVGVNESTVSRAVEGKWLRSPQGLAALRSFFSTGLPVEGGAATTTDNVRDLLRRMVAEEDPSAPLSDFALAARFSDLGIRLSRRVIAKYRSQLRIPPAFERKR